MYYNYKGSFSINLMSIVDAEYKFLIVDIGEYGSHLDGGLFRASKFGQCLEEGSLDIPEPTFLPGSSVLVPHVLIGDEAFQLRKDFLRPFPGKDLDPLRCVFNYRLNRARQCVENAFGILASRWRIFHRPINLQSNNAEKVVKACIILYNYLCTEERHETAEEQVYFPPDFADYTDFLRNIREGQWRKILYDQSVLAIQNINPSQVRNFSRCAHDVRFAYAHYFMETGQVSWQWDMLHIPKPN